MPTSRSISGWYFANIVLGGALAMVVIDPLTGAMYNLLPVRIEQPLKPVQTRMLREGQGFPVTTVPDRAG